MKKRLFLTLIVMLMYSAVSAQKDKHSKVLRHVVLFGWTESTDEAHINQVVAAFSDLKNKIPTIKSFEWGTNNSPENLNNGLTHCFIATFDSESDRDAYLIHPDHKAFVTLLNPAPEKVTVFDYWTTD